VAKGHRSQIKKARNIEQKDNRPKAVAKYVRVSPTKAQIVLNLIKGKNAVTARGLLTYSPRYAASVALKVLNSAIANAENNLGMDIEKLYVDEAFAGDGPIMKRIRPRAQGRAFRIEKKMSHISIILNER
jgi:large subunit ribosomal protein L22